MDSVEQALALLAEHGEEAKLLAGGHSLLPLMKLRLVTPEVVLDVRRIGELSYVREGDGIVSIGAMTRHCDIERSELLRREVPLLAHVAGLVGDPQIRHRGTIGGSVAHADPAADFPVALLALGATFVARGPGGEREVAADAFFTGFLETVLEPDELLTEVRVPKTGAGGWGYEKFTRRAIDWATVAVAVAPTADGDGGRAVALASMGPTPLRATAVEDALAAGAPAAAAAAAAADGTSPPADFQASAEYRRHLARVLTQRALISAGR